VISRVFPGLWLAAGDLLAGNMGRVLSVLQEGLASGNMEGLWNSWQSSREISFLIVPIGKSRTSVERCDHNQFLYREDFVWRRIATRNAIAKIIAVGDSPFSTIGVGSIGAMGGIVWLVFTD